MVSDYCGSALLTSLPDDVFVIVSRALLPRDLCNLSLCCRSLNALAGSDKVWATQCDMVGFVSHHDLVDWRKGVASYKALCRFLHNVQPLIGIWVHQNPELGNVVYVMPGFVSVVGCRIIPQELGPFGLDHGPILWAPVFEIIGDVDGSVTFWLHGREKEHNYFYPGSMKPIDRACNVLLLEVETRQQSNEGKLKYSKSFANHCEKEMLRKICRSDSGLSSSQRMIGQSASVVPFSRLGFGDRRKLLEAVTSHVRARVPEATNGPLFPCSREDENYPKDMVFLFQRRLLLMTMYKLGGSCMDWKAKLEQPSDQNRLELNEIRKSLDNSGGLRNSLCEDENHTQNTKRKSLGVYLRSGVKHILRKSVSMNGSHLTSRNASSCSESKHAQLNEFLRAGDALGLTLHACSMKLSAYRAWPNMHDNRFALYKLPMCITEAGQEYAGLWGGTFGWPPGRPTEDKPGKALFFLLLSYEESQGQRLLIATKILEGTHYVLHPNGSAMFIANVDEPSLDPFPWDTDGESVPVDVKNAYMGEGIANGYGFRYPGSKPGSLYVIQDGTLAFIWKESRAVLTLQRLNLQELLKKGERVHALPPVANFSYLTKSYSNVFAGFTNTTNTLSSPRFVSYDA
ncbi:hypothetical protein RJ641_009910 [Dillenia turbinata]|uniref:F-box domain-containing protein n=1 Tax=Dillenia turbinata TaxID=194707 RepID=A0AAN8UXC2_9MAGN